MVDYDIVAQGFLRLTNWFSRHGVSDCSMAFSMEACFEEAYEIRAAILTEKILGLGYNKNIAHSFCDRVVATQGANEKNMYDMGYGNQRNKDGMVNCSCVADCSSVARALIDTIKAYPGYSKNETYIESLRKFIDYVLERYVTADGVIGVGILDYKINPMPEYWCANGLFSQVLASFAEITGETKYVDAAVAPMEYLATFDYKNTEWKEWNLSPPMMILYSSEGILEGLVSGVMKKRLEIKPKGVVKNAAGADAADFDVCCAQAANRVTADFDEPLEINSVRVDTIRALLERRWNEYVNWLLKNQDACGLWTSPSSRGYRDYEPGLSWIIYRACSELGANRMLEKAVERQLTYLVTQEAKSYFGLFCRSFSTALAHLSFAYAAEKCMMQDPAGFEKALTGAQKNVLNTLW